MARILYSMAGEGRGHATRVRTMVEALRHEHELVLLAPDEAYEFLAPKYPSPASNVFVRRIPGLRFHYTRSRLNLTKSLLAGAAFWWRLPSLIDQLGRTDRRILPGPRDYGFRARPRPSCRKARRAARQLGPSTHSYLLQPIGAPTHAPRPGPTYGPDGAGSDDSAKSHDRVFVF